jgi:hypothetical protein
LPFIICGELGHQLAELLAIHIYSGAGLEEGDQRWAIAGQLGLMEDLLVVGSRTS